MHRIDTPTAQADKFGAGKNGFTNGDPATGRRATDLNSDMWDAVQEEICNVIERSGQTLDKEQHDQLYKGIERLISESIPDALIRSKNLADVADKAAALANINGVPQSRKINGKALSADLTLTATDVAALPLAGGTLTGQLALSNTGRGAWASQNTVGAPLYQAINTAGTSEYWPIFKQHYAQKNSTWSGGMLINEGDFHLHYLDSSGATTNYSFKQDGQFIPGNYANFDARYYTQAAADAKFQPKGSYTPAGQAYTKAESDARYGKGTTTAGSNSAYYTHPNGTVFMQAVRAISVSVNANVIVTLPTSFPNGIISVGGSFYGKGGDNSDSYYQFTPVGKNQVKIQTRNCSGTFAINVTGY